MKKSSYLPGGEMWLNVESEANTPHGDWTPARIQTQPATAQEPANNNDYIVVVNNDDQEELETRALKELNDMPAVYDNVESDNIFEEVFRQMERQEKI